MINSDSIITVCFLFMLIISIPFSFRLRLKFRFSFFGSFSFFCQSFLKITKNPKCSVLTGNHHCLHINNSLFSCALLCAIIQTESDFTVAPWTLFLSHSWIITDQKTTEWSQIKKEHFEVTWSFIMRCNTHLYSWMCWCEFCIIASTGSSNYSFLLSKGCI